MIFANKEVGETPLELLNRIRIEQPELKDEKLSYAGRLDPMAEGQMLILVGEGENKNRHKYLKLDKEYEVEVLLGIETDTGDVLGLINSVSKDEINFEIKEIDRVVKSFIGESDVLYPWFSSKTVNGKALHELARNKKFDINRPTTKLSIQDIDIIDHYNISIGELNQNVLKRISKVNGDFRQDVILKKWNKILDECRADFKKKFPILKIKIKCKSGSYMRTLSDMIAKKMNTNGIAYSIKRTKIGDFEL